MAKRQKENLVIQKLNKNLDENKLKVLAEIVTACNMQFTSITIYSSECKDYYEKQILERLRKSLDINSIQYEKITTMKCDPSLEGFLFYFDPSDCTFNSFIAGNHNLDNEFICKCQMLLNETNKLNGLVQGFLNG